MDVIKEIYKGGDYGVYYEIDKTVNGFPAYEQKGEQHKINFLFRARKNNFWYIGYTTLEDNGSFRSLGNTNSQLSKTPPKSGWMSGTLQRDAKWQNDSGVKVQKVTDLDLADLNSLISNVCLTVNISGNIDHLFPESRNEKPENLGEKSVYLGQYKKIIGRWSCGRFVYKNRQQKYLVIRSFFGTWEVCDDLRCSTSPVFWSPGTANNMNPADPDSLLSDFEDRTSWGHYTDGDWRFWTNLNVKVECIH